MQPTFKQSDKKIPPQKIRPKYQVFVSSTYSDLHQARLAVILQILKDGHIPVGMENFSADTDRGWKIIQKTIDTSDYYLLLLAGKYGSLFDSTDQTSMSWTEREYEYARKKGVPIIAFIRELSAIPGNLMDTGMHAELLSNFKNKLHKKYLVERWNDENDLKSRVTSALQKRIITDEDAKTNRPGWFRGSITETPIVRPNSGRWHFIVNFTKWRGLAISNNDKVAVDGFLDLWIPADTSRMGVGVAHGTLSLEFNHPPDSTLSRFSRNIRVVDRIYNAQSTPDGGIFFESETFSRSIVDGSTKGDNPHSQINGINADISGITHFKWNLPIDPNNPTGLRGRYGIFGDERDSAEVVAWK